QRHEQYVEVAGQTPGQFGQRVHRGGQVTARPEPRQLEVTGRELDRVGEAVAVTEHLDQPGLLGATRGEVESQHAGPAPRDRDRQRVGQFGRVARVAAGRGQAEDQLAARRTGVEDRVG